jgi:hypothetical protein
LKIHVFKAFSLDCRELHSLGCNLHY